MSTDAGDQDGTASQGDRQAFAKSRGLLAGEKGNFSGSTGLLFEQAMAQTRMAVCLSDPRLPDDPIVFCNEAFERLTGYSSEEIIGRNCRFLQGPETNENEVARIREALREEKVAIVELINYRKDGSKFWNALHLGPIYDDSGELKYFFGSQWDVSDVRAARAQEHIAKEMAREVSHRLKNVFAVITGIVNITGRAMKARNVADRIAERIQALGRSYEPTLDEAFVGTIEVGQAVRAVLRPYDPENERIRFTGNGLRVEPNAISAIGLTLHELAANATKYGALSNSEGSIDVAWREADDGSGKRDIVIEWIERDGPPATEPDNSVGTGFTICDALLGHAGGRLVRHWKREGLHAEIRFPVRY